MKLSYLAFAHGSRKRKKRRRNRISYKKSRNLERREKGAKFKPVRKTYILLEKD